MNKLFLQIYKIFLNKEINGSIMFIVDKNTKKIRGLKP